MSKDIRKMFENYPEESGQLSNKHEQKFEQLLMKEMHPQETKKPIIKWISIAASLALLVTVAVQFYVKSDNPTIPLKRNTNQEISLGNISPELNTIETYYVSSINQELLGLEITEDNKELIESFLNKVEELTKEYTSLTLELNTKGVNDETIDALIQNLQLRLQLMKRLKKQLKNLQELNKNNNENNII